LFNKSTVSKLHLKLCTLEIQQFDVVSYCNGLRRHERESHKLHCAYKCSTKPTTECTAGRRKTKTC